MVDAPPQRAWLLMAAGDDRGHGGNDGYDDQYDAYYSWDSNVPNHKNLRVGDPVAVWDKQRLLGVSVIESIETAPAQKVLSRCPACRTTRIAARSTVRPRYRCMKCHAEFDVPQAEVVDVERYTARYDAAWTSLDGLLREHELRAVQVGPRDFNAMRPVDWAAFRAALVGRGARRAVDRVAGRVLDLDRQDAGDVRVDLAGGFRHALVRVRRGQRQFRQHLLATQGSRCAFTGEAPDRVLEAGHLYSYARIGEHHAHGGLMLRRDIHRLFDDGMLAVDPASLRVDVSAELAAFPQYARLHDERLASRVDDDQVGWLARHWAEHRAERSADHAV